jgi:hypothetical protein
MVNSVGNWIQSHGYSARVTVAGADDIEDDWYGSSDSQDQNNIGPTTQWVNGYDAYAAYAYYDYGDAGGCPTSGTSGDSGGCNNGWTQDNIWYNSWGASAAEPLPEIYYSGMASEWQQISLYGYLSKGGQVFMQGSFTEWAASGYCTNGCTNEPAQGWTQLYDALNADWRTAQNLPYSSDISWSQT